MNQAKRGRVLVTGATGFVAGHCIADLLARGYDVRGTVRNLKTADMAHLRPAINGASGEFDLAEATLDADEGWAEAASGCDYVLHVASPIPFKAPRHEDELIRPAVDGTTRVLTAAAKAGVRRAVCTSSLDVITRNSATASRRRTESDWSDLAECNAYAKSKLLAEKRAWELAADHGVELAVVHPGAIIGPPLQVKRESSGDIVRRMLVGEMPAVPPLHLACTHVRDLAAVHRLALEVPEAKGNRYICSNGHLPMTGIAAILKEAYGPRLQDLHPAAADLDPAARGTVQRRGQARGRHAGHPARRQHRKGHPRVRLDPALAPRLSPRHRGVADRRGRRPAAKSLALVTLRN